MQYVKTFLYGCTILRKDYYLIGVVVYTYVIYILFNLVGL